MPALIPELSAIAGLVEAGDRARAPAACARAELQANYTALQALATSPAPSWPVIGAVVSSVRVILEGASGGVLAVKALGWLVTLTGG